MASSIPVVQSGRIRVVKQGSGPLVGPVVYWMFRDQRIRDNWALIHAVDQANKANVPVAIAFNLFDQFLGAKARQLGFMLRGLEKLHRDLENTLQIPFFLFQGQAVDTIPDFLKECGASLLVTDFSPLRDVRSWKEKICERVGESVTVHEVDAHNIIPLWVASDKLEYSARTLRGKINKLLPEYLIELPAIGPSKIKWSSSNPPIDWPKLIADVVRKGAEVPEIEWCEPGEDAALEVLMGSKKGFLTTRLKNYSTDRNNPLKPQALSGLSPYLHFGQISAQRCALEAHKVRKNYTQLWNASQLEMVHHGKMHGFMRMYWAKKILEWTSGPEEALAITIYLNDKYHIDGRDPSGYVGCMWSICGVHDQGWRERPVFGKIRYMNNAGCKRKFNVDGYISYVKRLVGESKKRKAEVFFDKKAKELRS
ncbi:deoxyribodipyrimidine photo-lyase isoform X2 [Lycium ferocissimum]|uniref:deoxyribodipyrimidine photo-lyase isoform X2 n=1 Tax=Lycium ferocissimum TaxID=112874 RepID=UPI0028153417|nr:deoxyribodipyrimidine photo-lyase isoform X2 [Lycium ferocissimum]